MLLYQYEVILAVGCVHLTKCYVCDVQADKLHMIGSNDPTDGMRHDWSLKVFVFCMVSHRPIVVVHQAFAWLAEVRAIGCSDKSATISQIDNHPESLIGSADGDVSPVEWYDAPEKGGVELKTGSSLG